MRRPKEFVKNKKQIPEEENQKEDTSNIMRK